MILECALDIIFTPSISYMPYVFTNLLINTERHQFLCMTSFSFLNYVGVETIY